jgi:hypothetical protein
MATLKVKVPRDSQDIEGAATICHEHPFFGCFHEISPKARDVAPVGRDTRASGGGLRT